MHSPYMYDLLSKIFDDQKQYYIFEEIEKARSEYLQSNRIVQDIDFGAGSHKARANSRTVAEIAGSAVSSPRKCATLFRLAEHVRPNVTVELGSSLGISSAYLASAYLNGNVYSFDGNPDLVKTARNLCSDLQIGNIEFADGKFSDVLPAFLTHVNEIDLAFIDGNHRKEPTLKYYDMLCSRRSPNAVFIFDDIRWSSEMFETWQEVKKDKVVGATIDAFSFGILFFSPKFKKRLDLTVIPDRWTAGPIFR